MARSLLGSCGHFRMGRRVLFRSAKAPPASLNLRQRHMVWGVIPSSLHASEPRLSVLARSRISLFS
jgi:hypothetical protein